jgi:hypothetical protein
MMDSSSSSNDVNEYYPITIVKKDSNFPLSLPPFQQQLSSSSSSSLKIATWKDERLEYLDIPKGLIELLQVNGFTVEKILEYGSSNIAEKLGIDEYVAQIIFNETYSKKTTISTNNITSNNFLTSYNSEELEEVSQEY